MMTFMNFAIRIFLFTSIAGAAAGAATGATSPFKDKELFFQRRAAPV